MYTRYISIYQRVPNLKDDTIDKADALATKFEKELLAFIIEFNRENRSSTFDTDEFGNWEKDDEGED